MDPIDLFIEALTGTRFHIRLLPSERVMSIKNWILHHEGIPTPQQHLIFGSVELNNQETLASYEIPNKATLKLVVSMKGGPIRFRRPPPSVDVNPSSSWREMTDMLECNSETFWENDGKPVTLILFRDGPNLNFFRVIENVDGTYSPLSQTLNGSSLRALFGEPEEDTMSHTMENEIMRSRIEALRLSMESVKKEKADRRKKKASFVAAKSPSASSIGSRRGSSRHLSRARSSRRTVELPKPVTFADAEDRDQEQEQAEGLALSLVEIPDARKETASRSSKARSSSSVKLPPIAGAQGPKRYRVASKIDTGLRNPVSIRRDPSSRINLSLDSELLRSTVGASSKKVHAGRAQKSKSTEKVSKKEETPEAHRNEEARPTVFGSIDGPRPKTTPNMEFGYDREMVSVSPALSTVSELGQRLTNQLMGTEIINILNTNRATNDKFHRAQEAQRKGAFLRGEAAPRAAAVVEINLSDPAEKEIVGAFVQMSLESNGGKIVISKTNEAPSSPEAPSRPERLRCSVCRKRLNLSNGFDCRCGKKFCSLHRYAETHGCTYDYKTEGRRQISESNPVVRAQKLPKI